MLKYIMTVSLSVVPTSLNSLGSKLRQAWGPSVSETFHAEVTRWPLWVPVFLGSGIALYFSLSFEPAPWKLYGALCLSLLCLWRLPALRLAFLPLSLLLLGLTAASFRTQSLHTPMLHSPLPCLSVEGTISKVDLKPTKKGSYSQRLLLTDLSPSVPLTKIWVTLKGNRERLWAGQRIRLKAKLSPPPDAALPGEFDFRRQAYFQGLGATGFALSAPEILENLPSWSQRLERKREEITDFLLQTLTPPTGAIAAALITGDKSPIPDSLREAFVNSGLAHILAISGLHLTIIAGVVFALFRRGLSLMPSICLFYNVKKIAALGTIFLTFAYLVLSGFGIPAERAFIMISLVMGAILMDRSALSMRTVAFAAFLILLLTPEAFLTASFQLSFAAVVGLVAGYETWRTPLSRWSLGGGFLRKGILYASGLAFTSLLATLSTLPFTLYIFHRMSIHAIEANLLAVPLTSLVIMPAAFLSCLLAPLSLGEVPLWILEKSIKLLISIATTVSTWPGANLPVAQPPLLSFALFIGGGLWLCLWKRPWRRWGLLPLFAGVCLLYTMHPPHILIDGRGKVAAVYDEEGTLHVSSTRRGKFTVEIWKKHLAAHQIAPLPCQGGVCQTTCRGIPLIISAQKEAQPCLPGAILIRLEPSQHACPEAALVIDWYDLWRGGSHALRVTERGVHLENVRPQLNHRPWQRKAIPRRKAPTQP